MNKSMKLGLIAASLLTASVAQAATQGIIDYGNTPSSTGDVLVQLEVLKSIQVNDLNDIVFPDVTLQGLNKWGLGASGDLVSNVEEFCVSTNAPTFFLQANGIAAAFEMNNLGDATKLPYSVEYATIDAGQTVSAYTSLAHGIASGAVSELRSSPTCQVSGNTRNNMALRITVGETFLQSASVGIHAETLTLLVSGS
jgi:hypothetical protein